MYGYIYKTTNLINGKVYVGQHKGSEFDKNYFGSGIVLKNAINKYGKENFVCKRLEMCEDLNTLNEREIYWIAKFDSTNKKYGYNLAHGGGGILGVEPWNKGKTGVYSEETLLNMSNSQKGKVSPMKGKHHTEEAKQKISKANRGKVRTNEHRRNMSLGAIGKKHSEETKKKIGEAVKGREVSYETRLKISKGNLGKVVSEESRRKMSESQKGKKASDETKKKMSESHKGKCTKSVINIDTNEVFLSVTDASEKYNTSPSSISQNLRGKSKTAKGFRWMYYEDYLEQKEKDGD